MKCIYPECNCPFDMGPDGKCLRGLKKMNKTEKLIAHFESGGTITASEARKQFGIQELRSTISRLKKAGMKIESEEEQGKPNAFSGKPIKCKRWFKA